MIYYTIIKAYSFIWGRFYTLWKYGARNNLPQAGGLFSIAQMNLEAGLNIVGIPFLKTIRFQLLTL